MLDQKTLKIQHENEDLHGVLQTLREKQVDAGVDAAARKVEARLEETKRRYDLRNQALELADQIARRSRRLMEIQRQL